MQNRRRFFGWKGDLLTSLRAGSQVVDTDKGAIEYAVRGTGPAILVVHGTPGGYDLGVLAFRELADRGYAVIAPSRPGYLQTPTDGCLTPAEQAELLAALLDKIKIERVVVAGLSGGGPCACEFALRFKERTAGLLLVSAVTRKYVPEIPHRGSFIGKIFDYDFGSWLISTLAHFTPTLMVKALVDSHGSFDEETANRVAEELLLKPEKVRYVSEIIDTMVPASNRKAGLENDYLQLRNLGKLDLQQIEAPSLIIHGTHDKYVPESHSRYAASTIPRAELLTIEKGFHLLDLSVEADMIWDRMQEFVIKCGPDHL